MPGLSFWTTVDCGEAFGLDWEKEFAEDASREAARFEELGLKKRTEEERCAEIIDGLKAEWEGTSYRLLSK